MYANVGEEIFNSLGSKQRQVGHNVRTTCPSCSSTRKRQNQKDPCLSVKVEADHIVWHCHHCGDKGAFSDRPPIQMERRKPMPTKDVEIAKSAYPIIDTHLDYLKSRGISEEALKDLAFSPPQNSSERLIKKFRASGSLTKIPRRNLCVQVSGGG